MAQTPSDLAPVAGMALVEAPLAAHEQGRADLHALLAALLLGPPAPELLADLAASPTMRGTEAPALRQAWQRLRTAARTLAPASVADEHRALFIAAGSPRVDPRASRYAAGQASAQPLAALRADLRALGLARRPGAAEAEDHLGALSEAMRLLITGAPGLPRQPLAGQRHFFHAHLAPWSAACLADLRQAEGARFYAVVADLAEAFFEIEAEAFAADGLHATTEASHEPVS